MPIQLQTSFVPKRPSLSSTAAPIFGGRSVNLFAVIAIIVFLAAAALAGGVFFYKQFLIRDIEAMNAQLAAARKSFEPEFVQEAARLNKRIEAVRELLSSHLSLSPLFEVLEKKTLESVRFRDFRFSGEDGRTLSLDMSGQAKSFNAVALQSDVFGQEAYFADPVFSNFSLNDAGDVLFKFKASIDRDLLLYSSTIEASPPAEAEEDDFSGGFVD